MPIELQVDSLDKVDPTFRNAYVEKEGKFHLDVDAYAEIKAEGLKRKNKELLGKARQTRTGEERIAELQEELKHYKLTTPLREHLSKAGVISDRLEVALEIASKHFKLEEDGEITVLDRYGNQMSVSPEKFIETYFREQHPYFYAASKAGGGGATNSTRGDGYSKQSMTRESFDRLSPEERMAFSKGGGVLTD